MRTPLSAIAAAAEIMKDERFGSMENERLSQLYVRHPRQRPPRLALINRLLGGETGNEAEHRFDATELDLNALAESSVSAVRPLADEAGPEARARVPPSAPARQS
ncbi:MAG: hypothetical protein WDN31_14220 [Hyphomicrobium sp.]